MKTEHLRTNQQTKPFSGQYSGIDKPNPSYHKKIAKFEETVTVLDSLRKPVKINILLDSGEKRSVLVKGGEDLRTDQRVMQVGYFSHL